MPNDPKTFGETIRSARLAVDPPLTQEALAEKLGVRQPSVSAWERGDKFPDRAYLLRIAELLELDVKTLLELIVAEEDLPEVAVG